MWTALYWSTWTDTGSNLTQRLSNCWRNCWSWTLQSDLPVRLLWQMATSRRSPTLPLMSLETSPSHIQNESSCPKTMRKSRISLGTGMEGKTRATMGEAGPTWRMEMVNHQVSGCEWVEVEVVVSSSNSREVTTINSKCSSSNSSSTTASKVTMGRWVDIMDRDKGEIHSTSDIIES